MRDRSSNTLRECCLIGGNDLSLQRQHLAIASRRAPVPWCPLDLNAGEPVVAEFLRQRIQPRSTISSSPECGHARQICRTERYLLLRQNVTCARELLVFRPRTQRVDALSCSRNLRAQIRQDECIHARYLLAGKIAEHDERSIAAGGKLRNRLTATQDLRIEHVRLTGQRRSLRYAAGGDLSPRTLGP